MRSAPEYEPFSLTLRASRADGLLGMDIGRERSATYLERLGFGTEGAGADELTVAVPADRHFDVTREVDLIEEVARVHGIDEHLPATLPARPPGLGGLAPHQALLRRAEDALARRRPRRGDHVELRRSRCRRRARPRGRAGRHRPQPALGGQLGDAHSSCWAACSTPRPTTSPAAPVALGCSSPGASICPSIRRAKAAFSTGTSRATVRRPPRSRTGSPPSSVARSSRRAGAGSEQAADFYVARGLVEHLCASLRADVAFAPTARPFLHPGRAAEVTIGGRAAGWVGELHPTLAAERDLPATVAFEIDAGALIESAARGSETYADLTSYPAVLEDLAVVLDAGVPAGEVVAAALEAGGELLASARIFDVYEGEQVGDGRRSLALRLEFRAPDRTLSDADVAGPREAIIAALAGLGGELRG